VAKKLR
jgi:hypothetical protein